MNAAERALNRCDGEQTLPGAGLTAPEGEPALEPAPDGKPALEPAPPPVIRRLGPVAYQPTWQAMQRFTDERGFATPDEIWFLEHPPVFTLGMNANPAHVLAPGEIPVVQIDRGGQVTYHGPGQLVVYPMVHLRRAGLACAIW